MFDEYDTIEWSRLRQRYDAEKARQFPNEGLLNRLGNEMLTLQSGSLIRTDATALKGNR